MILRWDLFFVFWKQRRLKEDEEAPTRLHDLITRRREARRAGNKQDVRDSSKLIQKEIRAIARARKSARVSKVLEEFQDLQRIAGIRRNGKRSCMTSVLDADGVEKTEAEDIAEFFCKIL